MTAAHITYRGADQHGSLIYGTASTDSIERWVEQRYVKGWRRLTVTRGDVEVGGIGRDEQGWRIWWAES